MSRATAFLYLPLLSILASALPLEAAITAGENRPNFEAVISVPDQKIVILEDGALLKRYPVSTSRFGVGDSCGSYKTPLGRLKICEKLGEQLPLGSVIRHRQATGEVLAANAPGRDPIVTRVLWLEGCESQNEHARERSIYIHGTVEESKIGKPVSWGCIRMRSEDVVALFDQMPLGASVTIINEKLPHYPKYSPPKPEPAHQEMLVAKQEAAPARPSAAPSKVPAAAAPTPIAEKESSRHTVVTVGPETTPVSHERKPIEVASVPPSARKAIEVVSTAPVHKSGDLTQSLRSSILSSGLGDANSEIPQLRQ